VPLHSTMAAGWSNPSPPLNQRPTTAQEGTRQGPCRGGGRSVRTRRSGRTSSRSISNRRFQGSPPRSSASKMRVAFWSLSVRF
jgi:hypothetical protein